MFLHGLGGSGKTELAKRYALKHKDRYDAVIANLKKSIALYENVLPYSEKHGYVVKYLAHTYHACYNHVEKDEKYLAKAKECLKKSGEIFAQCIEEYHPQMGSQYYAMGKRAVSLYGLL